MALLPGAAGIPMDSSDIDRVLAGLMGYEPERVILFGSMARGDADEYSDIDLIVVKKTSQRFVQRMLEAGSFVPRDLSVDILVYTPEEFQAMIDEGNPFIERALEEGKVLYENTGGDSQALAGPG